MTNEEAIKHLKTYDEPKKVREAFEMAIKTLEQEPILDKIRAEIERAADKQFQIAMGVSDLNERYAHIQMENAYRHSLNIIDKYRAESEVQEGANKEMVINESKKKIVIDNYFKKECDVNTSIKEAFTKGFELGLKKAPILQSKIGHWLMTGDYFTGAYGYVECSCCHEDSLEEGDFCPNCGAKMVELQERGNKE